MQTVSDKMNEFIDKVDELCFKYGYEIVPNTNIQPNEEPTILIKGTTPFTKGEEVKLVFIDGYGRGK